MEAILGLVLIINPGNWLIHKERSFATMKECVEVMTERYPFLPSNSVAACLPADRIDDALATMFGRRA